MLDVATEALTTVIELIQSIMATRPKVHKERVARLKTRVSIVDQQLTSAAGSVSDSAHLQQNLARLQELLNDMLKLLRQLEDEGWLKRIFKNALHMDDEFEELNQRLTQESMSLVLSLNIDARVLQQTFNQERRRTEDQSDRVTDIKVLEEMKETLLSVKKDTKQIIGMMEENKKSGSAPMSPVEVKVVFQNPSAHAEAAPPPPPYSPVGQPTHMPMVYQTQQQQVYQTQQQQVYQTPQMQTHPQQAFMYQTQPMQTHPQQAGPMAQQQPTQIQPQQTQVIICAGDLGDVSTMTTCRNCGEKVQTRVVHHSGAFAWLICGLCILFGLVCGCCVIPFFVDSCKDVHHFCSKCNVNLSIHKRM
ncbi:cell death-inducing p53-target protein 1-like isoform X1 [Sardina pilchardus]|uniref:cell death-inducing p53-target protein 1-like isoform X1 n=1 Tax=Sardina pilchardus TaxID=27697 RepID=UPI002E0FD3BD